VQELEVEHIAVLLDLLVAHILGQLHEVFVPTRVFLQEHDDVGACEHDLRARERDQADDASEDREQRRREEGPTDTGLRFVERQGSRRGPTHEPDERVLDLNPGEDLGAQGVVLVGLVDHGGLSQRA
jgi:hypothetical protein